MRDKVLSIKFTKDTGILFLMTFIYKITLEIGFYLVLTINTTFYEFEFSIIKYINGFIWCMLLFLFMKHNPKRASSFFLYLIYVLQIIPLSTIYAMMKDYNSPIYYNLICMGYLFLELLVLYVKRKEVVLQSRWISKVLILVSVILVILVLSEIYRINGRPTFMALDIYAVYSLRSSGLFQIGKYFGYLLNIAASAILPIIMAFSVLKKRYGLLIFSLGSQSLLYLYTGHKSYLFAIPLVIMVTAWLHRKRFYWELNETICAGLSVLSLAMIAVKNPEGIVWDLYSLLIRRSLIVPASLKFIHYDYFHHRPFLGLYGVLPRALQLFNHEYYLNISYAHDIGEIYFNRPEMSADTGFLAEGYARFGYIGIIMIYILTAIILVQIDNLQDRTSYAIAIGFFVFPIYALAEHHLVSSFVAGPWMYLLLILWVYRERQEGSCKNSRFKTINKFRWLKN